MDDAGNILIRRYSKSSVFVKSTAATSNEETAIGQDIVKLPGYSLEQEKIFKVRSLMFLFLSRLYFGINFQRKTFIKTK